MTALRDAAMRYAEARLRAWERAREELDKRMEEAVKGGRLPDNHWMAEYRAREMWRTARAFAEALDVTDAP